MLYAKVVSVMCQRGSIVGCGNADIFLYWAVCAVDSDPFVTSYHRLTEIW